MLFKICHIDIQFNDIVYHEHYVLETEKGLLLHIEQNHEDKRLSRPVIDIIKRVKKIDTSCNIKNDNVEKDNTNEDSHFSYSSLISIHHNMPEMSKTIFYTRYQLKEHLISYEEASKEHTSLLWLYEDYMAGASLKQNSEINITKQEFFHIFQQIEKQNQLKLLKKGWFIELELSQQLIENIQKAEKEHVSIMYNNLKIRQKNQQEYSSFRIDLLVDKLSKEYLGQDIFKELIS